MLWVGSRAKCKDWWASKTRPHPTLSRYHIKINQISNHEWRPRLGQKDCTKLHSQGNLNEEIRAICQEKIRCTNQLNINSIRIRVVVPAFARCCHGGRQSRRVSVEGLGYHLAICFEWKHGLMIPQLKRFPQQQVRGINSQARP